jgi:hypothetical protein
VRVVTRKEEIDQKCARLRRKGKEGKREKKRGENDEGMPGKTSIDRAGGYKERRKIVLQGSSKQSELSLVL